MTRPGEPDRELLELYARELAYLRERGAEFAKDHPKIAARLGLSSQGSSDPHVERLIEAFAFLTTRLARELEAELPLYTNSLLGSLAPQLVCPVPAMAIACFEVDPKEAKLGSGYTIDKHTPLFAASSKGPECHFRTALPVTLWPIEITQAAMVPPETLEVPSWLLSRAAAALQIDIASGGLTLDKLGMRSLRFHIAGGGMQASNLYDLIAAQTINVLVGNPKTQTWSSAKLRTVGFDADEDVLPYPAHASRAHRLVQEYFAFPDKFHFFDLVFTERTELPTTKDARIIILFGQKPDKPVSVKPTTLKLGCTPVINLFPRNAEPIRVDQTRPEYRLVADARRERTTEIHSITRVAATAPGEPQQIEYVPFFSFVHHRPEEAPRAFWHLRRVPTGRKDLPGTDVLLTFVNTEFVPTRPPSETVYANVLCTNRDLAGEVGKDTRLSPERPVPASKIVCISKPTPQRPAPLGGQALWRLVSNLTQNHLAVSDNRMGAAALREMLRGYVFGDAPEAERQIDAIASISSRVVTRRMGSDSWRGHCRGLEITMTLDDGNFAGSSPVLFASVLSRYFALQAHINSFTELVLRRSSRDEEWKRWPPTAGEKALL